MPVDQYGGAADSDGTVAFVAGGYSFLIDDLDTLYKFNPSTNTWAQLTSMPDANIMASAVYYPPSNKLYVFGGEDPESGTELQQHPDLRHRLRHVVGGGADARCA